MGSSKRAPRRKKEEVKERRSEATTDTRKMVSIKSTCEDSAPMPDNEEASQIKDDNTAIAVKDCNAAHVGSKCRHRG